MFLSSNGDYLSLKHCFLKMIPTFTLIKSVDNQPITLTTQFKQLIMKPLSSRLSVDGCARSFCRAVIYVPNIFIINQL